ncbi:MAG: hypothetical protein M1440_02710 [Gammaproteobacteria bacterium]|nr:hypothetical protein [Gammaproteobacteria bacterium]
MFSLRKTALIGLSVSAIALSGCLSSGSSGSSNPVSTPEPLTEQQQRINDGFFFVDDSVVDDFEPLAGIETERFAG